MALVELISPSVATLGDQFKNISSLMIALSRFQSAVSLEGARTIVGRQMLEELLTVRVQRS
jgi:hypothetical protein